MEYGKIKKQIRNIWVIFRMEKKMEKEGIFLVMGPFMKAVLKMMFQMVKEV